MINLKTIFVGAVTVTSIGFATASSAYAGTVCIDGTIEYGDCIPVPDLVIEDAYNDPGNNGNNGWGNGDQDAPGNSLDNNNAENHQGSDGGPGGGDGTASSRGNSGNNGNGGSKGNNGFGNGDQEAPGGSGDNNNAENASDDEEEEEEESKGNGKDKDKDNGKGKITIEDLIEDEADETEPTGSYDPGIDATIYTDLPKVPVPDPDI